ncbi:MAG: hypothetical protein HYS51_00045 [Candidatus Zambryskibacteria bacterium]|nr:hypothetical protein [Candidatus Zambryskibacteria bacterium]
MKEKLRRVGTGLFVVLAIVSFAINGYSFFNQWRGETMTGTLIGIADIKVGERSIPTLAFEVTNPPIIGKKYIAACGELVDDGLNGLKFTFLGDVYESSPKVEFQPINVSYKR